MRLPSHLVKNRFGVFYFRITIWSVDRRKERRWSLRTKHPSIAKYLALQLNAALFDNSGRLKLSVPHTGNANDGDWEDEIEKMIENNWMHLVTMLEKPNGEKITLNIDQSDPNDVAAAKQMAEVFLNARNQPIEEILPASDIGDLMQTSKLTKPVPATHPLSDIIDRFQKRWKGELVEKTLYEYEKMQRRFEAFILERLVEFSPRRKAGSMSTDRWKTKNQGRVRFHHG